MKMAKLRLQMLTNGSESATVGLGKYMRIYT
jgi:hypothetical protein